MGNKVSGVTRQYIHRRRLTDNPERTLTFSIRMTEGQNAKLLFLADKFGDSKSAVAQRLLDAAMEDSLRSMGSSEVNDSVGPTEANKLIDEKVEGYRSEIQRIFDKEIST